MKTKTVSSLRMLLTVLFTVCILLSNIVANKQFAIGNWSTPAGVLVFPITYVLSDVFSEVYGYKWSRKTAWIGFAMNLFMVFIFWLTLVIPGPAWFEHQAAYEVVLGNTPRLLVAGLAAYMLGDLANDVVFEKMRRNKNGLQGFGLRAVASSFAGELVDSCVFMSCAFIGTMPIENLPSMIIIQVIIKVGYEIVILPFTSIIVRKVKAYEQNLYSGSSV